MYSFYHFHYAFTIRKLAFNLAFMHEPEHDSSYFPRTRTLQMRCHNHASSEAHIPMLMRI